MAGHYAWIAWTGVALGVLALVVVALVWCGKVVWANATKALLSRLESSRLSAATRQFDARELDGLPAPVQRYFRAVLKDGQPIIVGVVVQHKGTFNVSAGGERWMPFTSSQRVLACRPGFVWSASVVVVPGIAVVVHDAYVAGEGTLHAALIGLFSLARVHGAGEIARGELARYLAEAAWYPTTLLPSQGVRWVAIDDRSADATLVDGAISLTMRFMFDDAGLIEATRLDARGAVIGGKVVMTPWECRLSNYQERDGMRVPLTGEAAWLRPDGRQPYWRGTIVSAVYEFARDGMASRGRISR